MSGLKMCARCLQYKPRGQFSADPRPRDGLQSYCKSCRNAYTRERRRQGEVRTHGYGGYSNGCKCDICTAAKAAYMRKQRAAARGSRARETVSAGDGAG